MAHCVDKYAKDEHRTGKSRPRMDRVAVQTDKTEQFTKSEPMNRHTLLVRNLPAGVSQKQGGPRNPVLVRCIRLGCKKPLMSLSGERLQALCANPSIGIGVDGCVIMYLTCPACQQVNTVTRPDLFLSDLRAERAGKGEAKQGDKR